MNARPTACSIALAALLVLLASCDQPRPEPPEQPPSPTAVERDADDGPDLGIDATKDGGSAFLGPLTTSVAGEGEDQDFLRKAAAANALELAAALSLEALTVVVVDNGSSSYAVPGRIEERFLTDGWHAVTIDGRDHDALEKALSHREVDRPNVVVATVERKY